MPSPNLSISASAAHYEALFHSSALSLHIPEVSDFQAEASEEATDDGLGEWWGGVEASQARDTAYFDEKLLYLVSLHLPDDALRGVPGTPALDAKEPTSEMLRFLGRLQLSMTASFIPPLPPIDSRSRRDTMTAGFPSSTSVSANSLAPPSTSTSYPNIPSTPRTASTSDGGQFPPVTPNPFPSMSQDEEQYAHVEGVIVWEGAVEEVEGPWEEGKGRRGSGGGRKVFKVDGGWRIVWRGEVPIAYVRTQIQDPLLALTASVTLREAGQPKTHRKGAPSLDTMSIKSGTTIRTEGTEFDDYGDADGDAMAGMQEIDLLGGLAGSEDPMPATRLAPSIRQDLSLPSAPLASPLPLSAQTPNSIPAIMTASTDSSGPSRERGQLPLSLAPVSTTLRKSYRRVLSLAPGLRVRMRTLFLPQLLISTPSKPSDSSTNGHRSTTVDEESEGERRIVLCVEIENSVEPTLAHGFEVEQVSVEVGGKGGKATTELVCQPDTASFPLRLGSTEQYNLLCAVEIASPTEKENQGHGNGQNRSGLEEAVARSLGRGDEQRPVSITVTGRPFYRASIESATRSEPVIQDLRYPTKVFQSRWNCSLDLTSFYAASAATIPHLPKNRASKILSPIQAQSQSQTNAIAGDKRYSLAHLLNVERERDLAQSQGRRGGGPMLPSQAMNQPSSRVTSLNRPRDSHQSFHAGGGQHDVEHGLLLSVKLLSNSRSGPTASSSQHSAGQATEDAIKALDQFSLEVFVHNRTEQVKRFRLSIPSRQREDADGGYEGKVRDVWERRRRRGGDEPDGGVGDAVLKSTLAQYTSSAPALIPLENDIRCGPLLPGSSLSARIRFLALREGVHKVEKLRLVGDDFDFVLT
ncbi:hypothetical protein I317_00191 [Kwoniella heveanensis CBS 569]|nr:hypothetical protein I317_00191 [Kwoniella heveanensis CBS 569]